MKIKIRKQANKQVITELTEDEYDFVKEALEIPPSELPFSNIFGDKYRVLTNFETLNEGHPLTEMIEYLEFNGWSLEPHIDDQALKFSKSYRVVRPSKDMTEVDSTPRTKTITLTLQKIIQNMANAFENSLPKMARQYQELTDQAREANNKVSGFAGSGGSDEELDALIDARNKIQRRQVPIAVKLRNTLSMYLREKDATQPIRSIADGQSIMSRAIVAKIKEFQRITTDEAKMTKWQQSFSELFEPAYVIFSRHPVDVYRMSDFVELASCHSPPTMKRMAGKGTRTKFDQLNICALAEAYANGMIAYAVPAKEFRNAGWAPTQKNIEAFEDDELFKDDMRGVGQITPKARIRIRNTAYTDPDTGNVIRFAVPDQKVYGNDVGGFTEFVRNHVAKIQKDDIEKIYQDIIGGVDDGAAILELDNFERFGGSYMDSGKAIRQNLPLMFASALDEDPVKFTSGGYLKYDRALENQLLDRATGSKLFYEQAVDRAKEIAERQSLDGRWKWKVSLQDLGTSFYIDDVELIISVPMPENIDMERDRFKISELLNDYIKDGDFNLQLGSGDDERIIKASRASLWKVGETFDKPHYVINYSNLQQRKNISWDQTEYLITMDNLEEKLALFIKPKDQGGMSLVSVTKPNGEFAKTIQNILTASGYLDGGPEWYLELATNEAMPYSKWDEVDNEFENVGGIRRLKSSRYIAKLKVGITGLKKDGYTEEEIKQLLNLIGNNEKFNNWLVNKINIECQNLQDIESVYNGIDIPFEIKKGDNNTNFILDLSVTNNQIDTKEKRDALYALLRSYNDSIEHGIAAIIFDENKDEILEFINKVAPSTTITENKRRMRIRILRG